MDPVVIILTPNLSDFGMCNILAGSNCHDSNGCNHEFWVPLKTCGVQIESELEPLYDWPFFLIEY